MMTKRMQPHHAFACEHLDKLHATAFPGRSAASHCDWTMPSIHTHQQSNQTFRRGRIGTEHEKLVVRQGSRERARYAEIEHILDALVERHGWEADLEDGTLTGAKVQIGCHWPIR